MVSTKVFKFILDWKGPNSGRLVNSKPSSSKAMYLLLAIPCTWISSWFSRSNFSFCWEIMRSSADPMRPVPTKNKWTTLCSERKNTSWRAFKAFCKSACGIMAEIFNSELPWAMAVTLMLFWPNARNILPEVPGSCFMFSPTTATKARPGSKETGSISPDLISWKNSCSINSFPKIASSVANARQMLCCEEAWEISKLENLASDNTVKIRPKLPPAAIQPALWSVIRVRLDRELIPLIQPPSRTSPLIKVPGWLGSKVFLIWIGMFFFIAGCMVAGKITLAPKWESSIASA